MKPGDVLPEEACRALFTDGPLTGAAAADRLGPLLGVDHDEALHILWEQADAGLLQFTDGLFRLRPT